MRGGSLGPIRTVKVFDCQTACGSPAIGYSLLDSRQVFDRQTANLATVGWGRPERAFGADFAAEAASIAERRDLGQAEVVNSTAVSHYDGATVLSE